MSTNPYESRALVLMREKLTEDLQALHTYLGDGSFIIREDSSASGMNCARVVGKIEGLKLAMTRLTETSEDLSDRPKDKKLEKD